MSCLDETTIARFVAGEVPPSEVAGLESHLDGCAECRSLLAAAARAAPSIPESEPGSAPTELAPGSADGPLPGPLLLPPGEVMGRYLIEERIGAGGMGTVYAAHDPELGRRIAIKVLRPEVFGASGAEDGRRRLRREAQSLASLSHPNIVTVHDVGTHHGRVFVAMELVEGVPLSRWLQDRSRTWQEVREVMLQAGRGLAAAHATGLIHRDFKPDNVLVGDDGRVRVTDFGLARSAAPMPARPTPSPDQIERAEQGGSDAAVGPPDLTRTGITVGTPAYMAPEQHRGTPTDPRSDQFAYCIVLYEALCGRRPFTGDSVAEITRAVLAGRPPALPREARLPVQLARIVSRGLRKEPDERYPSMEALLSDLAFDPTRARRRVALGALAALVVAVVGGLAWALANRDPGPCEALERQLAGIWDGPRREAVERAFLATGKPYAPNALRGATAALDGYAGRWLAARRRSCEALRASPGAPVGTRTVQCLEGRLAELRAVTDALSRADSRTVERALVTAHGLGRLASCEDPRRLPPPEPEDAATRAQVEVVRGALARARILYDSGRYRLSRSIAATGVQAALKVAYAPLLAEAWYRLGISQLGLRRATEAERSFRESLLAAEGSRHDELSARARVRLVWVVGYLQGKAREVEPIIRHARASLRRIGGDEVSEADLASYLASIASRAHRIPEALDHAHRSLALREKHYGAEHPEVATSLQGLAITFARAGRYREALPHFQRVLAIRERALGPRHPLVATACTNLGILLRRLGRLEEALVYQRRAVDISRAALGEDDPGLAADLHNLGNTLHDLGRTTAAGSAYREALAIRRRVLPAGHQRTLHSLSGTAVVALDLGRADEAARVHRQVVAGLEKLRGRSHPSVAEELANLARAELRRGSLRSARVALDRSLAILEPRGRQHPRVAEVLLVRGELALAEGHPGEAERIYQRALAIRRKAHGEKHWRVAELLVSLAELRLKPGRDEAHARKLAAQALAVLREVVGPAPVAAAARFLLARAEWARREERPRALALARQARASLAGRGDAARLRARIDRWLAERTGPARRR